MGELAVASKTQVAEPAPEKRAVSNTAENGLSMDATGISASCACGGECPSCKSTPDTAPNERKTPIQRGIAIGKPDDAYETEADLIAARVMRMPQPATAANDFEHSRIKIQRSCSNCDKKEDALLFPKIQRSSSRENSGNVTAKAGVKARSLDNTTLTSGGDQLPAATRSFFESRFNRDLSSVRLHAGTAANDYCNSLDAHAFTFNNHVWLGKGLQASPSFVLAHELAHVVQQTQPNILNRQSSDEAGLTRARAASHNTVQRLPFWVPIDTKLGDVMSGSAIHAELLKNPEGKNKVSTEAPVPNANRKDWGLGLQGFADLYRASSRVGVFFQAPTGLIRGDQGGLVRHTNPAKPNRAGTTPKPVLTKAGTIDDIGAGPNDIELGELKPAVKSELGKGNEQLKHYEEGFKDTAKLVNKWGSDHKAPGTWKLNSVKRLPDKDVEVADKHKPGSATAPDRDLALADIDESSSGTSKYSVKKIFMPKPYLGQNIPGKLSMEPFGQGLWMYYAKPNDFSKALDTGKFKNDKPYMKAAKAVQDEVIGNLTKGPKKITLLHRHRNAVATPHITALSAPAKILRKDKPAKLKDHFDLAAYEKWDKRRNELGLEVRGKGTAKMADDPYKKLEFLEHAVKAENQLHSKAQAPKFPTTSQLKEQIKTGTGKEQITKDTSLDKLYPWLERWTSYPYKILGQFRLRFGGVFMTAVNKFNDIKESVSKKVHDYFANHPKAKKAASVLFKALKTALKQVVNIIVPRTLHLVMDAIVNGAKKKVEELFADTFVEKQIDKFKGWWEGIKDYGDKAVEYIKKVEKDFLEKFDWIGSLLDDVKWIWRLIKAGRVLLKCRKPPILGCFALLLDEAKDDELNCILCIPRVQKEIGSFVMALPWFKSMPPKLGNMIMGTLKDAVPDSAKILKDIFSEKIPDASADIDDIQTECDAKCDGFGLFKMGGAGSVSKGDMESAGKMSDFRDKLSKEQIKDLLKEAERQGELDKPFDQKKAEEMLKEAEKNKSKNDDNDKKEDKQVKPEDQKKTEPKDKKKPEDKKQDKQAPEDKTKTDPKKQKEKPKDKPKDKTEDKKKPEGGSGVPGGKPGQGGVGTCVWDSSMLETGVWVRDKQISFGWAHGLGSDPGPFDKKSIEAACSVTLEVLNDFYSSIRLDCPRPGNFTPPTVSSEITLDGKVIFKKTDKKPKKAGSLLFEPSWGRSIILDPITADGELRVKLTMTDPDTGISKTFDGKIKIIITTPDGVCCNCIT